VILLPIPNAASICRQITVLIPYKVTLRTYCIEDRGKFYFLPFVALIQKCSYMYKYLPRITISSLFYKFILEPFKVW
jgi:dolichyl-phosphate-mannose--protein O-mannosyl transferase